MRTHLSANQLLAQNQKGEKRTALAFPLDYGCHPRSEIEWWYLYSFLGDRYTFMACFWRYSMDRPAHDGLMATYALTEINGKNRWQGTLVNEAMFRHAREILAQFQARKPDFFFEAMLELTDNGEIFAPYRLSRKYDCLSSDERPIDISLGSCRLWQDADREKLHLEIVDDSVRLDLFVDLSSRSFPLNQTGRYAVDGRSMWGYTHPQAPTEGTITVNGRRQEIAGRSWFDHQWGERWFGTEERRDHHPEWLYFAMLLDDGRSVIIYQNVYQGGNGREKAILYALLCFPDGTTTDLGAVETTCHDHIQSLRTSNLYEYGWSIRLPDHDGVLELTTYHADQEVYVFTGQRGIMELGCRVRGRLGGRPCQGVGFVEIVGQAADINDFFWGQQKANLARQLKDFIPRTLGSDWLQNICGVDEPLRVDKEAIQRAIIDPVWSMMDRGGKGWRSAWLVTCCYALAQGRVDPRVSELLPCIELLHTGSLIIDDIQDRSTMRRGKPTLHEQIGMDLAINVGNFLYYLPLVLIREADWLTDKQRSAIYETVMNSMRRGHIGQAVDLMWSKGRYDIAAKVGAFEQTREELLEQYRLKSGYHLEAVARMAGILAEAPEDVVNAVAGYSRDFGVVFQIVDDLIDVQEGRAKLGKVEGEDVRNGKLNMVLLYALSAVERSERSAWVKRIFYSSDDNGLELARSIIHTTDAVERCIAFAEEMMEKAWKRIALVPPTDAKVIMRSVPRWLLHQRKLKQRELRKGHFY